jgi:hypothetical protein
MSDRNSIAMKLAGIREPYALEPEATMPTPEQAAREAEWKAKVHAMPPPSPGGAPVIERQGPLSREEMQMEQNLMEYMRQLEEQKLNTPQGVPMSSSAVPVQVARATDYNPDWEGLDVVGGRYDG